ncbi:septation ring formation regulator EzrA [Trichococcus shcherbakoviae]|uniref:Septation ring formation regulator EzrA n=2 Tax=Trichococcus shcherbakoviae TaxID=2094020 RepID=A0A383TEA7_9LACT|nr:septation ring formation regulator EzrA [Trichococcus shcherbakoviae]OUL09047.1 selenide, water dikinase [Sedimentibacter sp. SX930]TNV69367.1 selenide, water dikinase [Trichococcus shcherbakoviae subsp. psychrophilus]SYZ78700.1 septation ring formation regulator ezra [Trichococcus shcherbakoviae]
MEFIYWLVAIILLVLIGYGAIMYLTRQQANRIKAIDEKKQKAMAIPVADNLFTLKNMNLTGQTKRTYESWQATWQTITRFQYPEIEAALVSAEQYIQRMNFIKAKQAISQADQLIDETKNSVEKVNKALEKLLESAQENRKELEEIQERYNKIRKQLLAHSFTFGPAIETLEKNLNYMELDFTKFNSLTNEGDHMEAKEILSRIEQDLLIMEEVVEKIPQLNEKIKTEYEEQVNDLKDGFQRLLDEKYIFEGVDVSVEIAAVEKEIQEAKDSIGLADINEAGKKMDKVERDIEAVYAIMEKEMEAKDFVGRHTANLQKKMDHVLQSNRYVLLEIDRVSQNYFLNKNELGRAQEFEEQLLKENEALRYYDKMMKEHEISYSVVREYYEKISQRLSEIDKEQSELVSNLSDLRNREKEIKDSIDLYELDMRNMKRTIEKYHLPGLPKIYLDLFFSVTDRIEDLASKLNRVKIDMDEIDAISKMCEEDIEMLDNQTQAIVDNAMLTEYMIQYANRFRHSHVEIENAINKALVLFHREYDYEGALEAIKIPLNRVEAGAARKVEESYQEEKNRNYY